MSFVRAIETDHGEVDARSRLSSQAPPLLAFQKVIDQRHCNHTNHGGKDNHEVKDIRATPADVIYRSPDIRADPNKPQGEDDPIGGDKQPQSYGVNFLKSFDDCIFCHALIQTPLVVTQVCS
jgi:hypothetical protein